MIYDAKFLIENSKQRRIIWLFCRHFERFWGASKSFYEDLWQAVFVNIFGGNSFVAATFGNMDIILLILLFSTIII